MPPTPTCSRSFSTFSRSFRRETLPKRVSDDSRQLNFRRQFFFSTICFRVGHRFSSFWASFGASTGKRTSPSTSPQFFALDAAIMGSVRPKIDEKLAVGACTGGGERTLHDRGFRAVVGRGRGGELTLTHQTPRGRWIFFVT